ncbi:MAG: hypothetical protein GYB65_00550 [Chloroflexi bacterium]|nr:hypothetical protein [Chloroflexota bacterium]
MTLRSQIGALVVILAALGLVFWAVSDSGVNTDVEYESNWTEVDPALTGSPSTVLTYANATEGETGIEYDTIPREMFSRWLFGQELDFSDAEDPIQAALQFSSDDLVEAGFPPEYIEGPVSQEIDGIPVTWQRIHLEDSVSIGTDTFPPLELTTVVIEAEDEQLTVVRYIHRGPPDPEAYAEFQLWLRENAATLAAPTAEEEIEIWVESEPAPGEFTYTYMSKPDVVTLEHRAIDLAELATTFGVQPPPEDEAQPQLYVLYQWLSLLQQQAFDPTQVTSVEGPMIEIVGGVPVAYFRIQLISVDLVETLIDKGDGMVEYITFVHMDEPDDAVYDDFRTWLEANAAQLSQPVEEDDNADVSGAPELEGAAAAPRGNADNWIADQAQPGLFVHATQPNTLMALNTMSLDELAASMQVVPPPADSPLPLLDILNQIQQSTEEALVTDGMAITENTFEGPEIRDVNGTPVALFRYSVPASETRAALDDVMVLIESGDDQYTRIIYHSETPDTFDDFLAWLNQNAGDYAAPGSAESAAPSQQPEAQQPPAEPPQAPELVPPAQVDPDVVSPADPAVQPPQQAESTDQQAEPADPQPEPDAVEPDAVEPDAVEPDAEERDLDASPLPGQDEFSAAIDAGNWTETAPGEYAHVDGEGTITVQRTTIVSFVADEGIALPPEGSTTPTLDLLDALNADRQENIDSFGNVEIDPDNVVEPTFRTYDGVEVAFWHLAVAEQETENGLFPPINTAYAIIEHGPGDLTVIAFEVEGGPNPAVYDDFITWLENNIAALNES